MDDANQVVSSKPKCYHCGDDCSSTKISIDDKHFCCNGCKMVFEILNQSELCAYYDLNQNPGNNQKVQFRADKFEYLDSPEIAQKLIDFTDGKQVHITFFLPQMHCSSCLYLLENIHKLEPGVISSRVNFTQKECFIIFDTQKTSLRKVVEILASIGYEPHISLQDLGARKAKQYDRTRLYKIGVAGFCFANSMMLSLPEYFAIGGFLEKEIGAAYRIFVLILSLPVLFYCSTEFFETAWKGLKNKFLNIDLPIALAVAITFLRSIYELYTHSGSGYFDSMSGIVFFMLVGRHVQDITYRSISFDRDFKSFFPIAVNVLKDGRFKPLPVEQIRVNDIVQIHGNELIPVDAILSKGTAQIDYSFVSGESLPLNAEVGELVYAGGKQMAGNIELLVVKEVSQSYLTNLWNKDVFKAKKESLSVIHTLSKYFTAIVFVIGGIAAAYWWINGQPILMWNALTTILIVACPCALLLSSTFTNGNILRILSKNKLYLRHPDVIEDLSKVDHIVFDKTGTLTDSKKNNLIYEGRNLGKNDKEILASLLVQSAHPLSKIVFDYLDTEPNREVVSFKNVVGQGIEAWIDDVHVKIGAPGFVGIQSADEGQSASSAQVFIKLDKDVLGVFKIQNAYRYGLLELMQKLQVKYAISVLSGDNNSEYQHLKSILGDDSELLFDQRPDQKLAYIKSLQDKGRNVLMIGDGLNDAGALKQSNVGIAIADSTNNFTPASDGILDAEKFTYLNSFLSYANKGQQIMLASFVLSILYNIIGLYFAVQGTLSPLIAAILMPSSSLSIILITYGMSELSGKKYKL